MTINQSTTEISAGWSLFPVAVLPGASTLEVNFTSGKFQAELFSMTNAVDFEDNEHYQEFVTERLEPDAATKKKLVLSQTPIAGTISIGNLTAEGGTPDYTVADKTITLATATDAPEVEVSYQVEATVREALIDNRASAVGEVVLKYPVYSDGTDCTSSGIIGYAYVDIFKARVSAQPAMAGSYKSASTYDFTLSAIDSKRADGKAYKLLYKKLS